MTAWSASGSPAAAAATSTATPPTRVDLTVDELLARYLEWAKTYYVKNGRPTREQVNLKHSMKPLSRLYGSTPINEFSPSRLKVVRQAIVDQGLARRTVNDRIHRIRRIVAWGVENEHVRGEVLYALKAVSPLKVGRSSARETEPVTPVAQGHVDAVLKIVPPHAGRNDPCSVADPDPRASSRQIAGLATLTWRSRPVSNRR